jgi:hypothetical protein
LCQTFCGGQGGEIFGRTLYATGGQWQEFGLESEKSEFNEDRIRLVWRGSSLKGILLAVTRGPKQKLPKRINRKNAKKDYTSY